MIEPGDAAARAFSQTLVARSPHTTRSHALCVGSFLQQAGKPLTEDGVRYVNPVGSLRIPDARLHGYHTTSNTRWRAGMPLSCLRPASRNSTPASEPPTARTTSDTRICPPWALAAMRAARVTAVPK